MEGVDPVLALQSTEICKLLFIQVENSDRFRCRLCDKEYTQQRKSGVGNLLKHLDCEAHRNQWRPYLQSLIEGNSVMPKEPSLSWLRDKIVANAYQWADLLTAQDLPFPLPFQSKTLLEHLNVKAVSERTLRRYLVRAACILENDFGLRCRSQLASTRFVILSASWELGSGGKRLGAFLGFPDESEERCKVFILCSSLLVEEDDPYIEDHFAAIEEALKSCGISWDQILLLVAEYSNVNLAIARRIGKPLISCKAQALDLAAEGFVRQWEPLIEKVDLLMKKLHQRRYREILRESNMNLAPKIRGIVRARSTLCCNNHIV